MKQQKEILSNKMKNIFFLLLTISLQSCSGQEKDKKEVQFQKLQTTKRENENPKESSIDFLEKKYQINGFNIPDLPNPYPTYSFSSSDLGNFTVNYIGKTNEIQYFWNINNTGGYFSKYPDAENASYNSDDIKKYINPKDYYIIATYINNKYILNNNFEKGEFDLKADAKTQFYLYSNSKWKLIEEIETSKIPENLLSFETSLIQKDLFKNLTNSTNKYNRMHSITVETEATTTGMASISYSFDIKGNSVKLSLETYHESILCEGKYFASEKENMLEIYYFDNNLSCISINPKFFIKKENNKFYIKGVGGEATNSEWLLLEQI